MRSSSLPPPPYASLAEVRGSIAQQLVAHGLPAEGPAAGAARNVGTGLYLELEHVRREVSRLSAALRVIRDGCTCPEVVASLVLSGESVVRTILCEETGS